MSRLVAFWAEFYSQVSWIGTAEEKAKRIGTQVSLVILLVLGVAPNFAELAEVARPYLRFCLIPVGVYATWKAAVAWERTRGPSIQVDPIEFDEAHRIFWVQVTNGPVDATIELHIASVRDPTGLNRIEHPWQGHWRGKPPTFDGRLARGLSAKYGLLLAHTRDNQNPVLSIFTKDCCDDRRGMSDKAGNWFVPVTPDCPISEQGGTLAFTVHADCYVGEDDKKVWGRKIKFTFSVAPDPSATKWPYRLVELT